MINNSITAYDPAPGSQQGVLHTARIPNPRPEEKRIVNSMMIGIVDDGEPDHVTEHDLQTFLTTSEVRERMYA